MTQHRDLKDALSNARKADTTHVRRAFLIYTARPCEYGNDKYERGNYRRPTGDGPHTTPTRADFERYRAYLRAARDHIDETLDAMELHLATDPQLLDIEGMKRAAYAVDTDVTPGAKVGASMLPHVAPACASLNMAITQATDCGLLPRDPGTPWRDAIAVAPPIATAGAPNPFKFAISVGDPIWLTDHHGIVQPSADVVSPVSVDIAQPESGCKIELLSAQLHPRDEARMREVEQRLAATTYTEHTP